MEVKESTLPDKALFFDKSFRDYIKKCKDTIKDNFGDDMDKAYRDPNMETIKNYFRLYKKMNVSEHYQYFEKIYSVNRSQILSGENDEWIRKGDIIIQLGGLTPTGNKATDEKRKRNRIYVSNIYNLSCDLRDQTKDLYNGIDMEYIEEKGKSDMKGPDLLLLSIMMIFFHLNSNDDKVLLVKIINKLEDKLGITIKTEMANPTSNINIGASSDNTGSSFSGLFSIARTIMESSGIKPPPDMKTPTDGDVSKAINAVFQNEGTQNVIQKMVSSLQGCTDIGTAIQSVVKDIANPTTISALQTSIQQTAQEAVGNNTNNNTNTNNTNNSEVKEDSSS
jgi:DNA-binding FrmR family transcriptional regulator